MSHGRSCDIPRAFALLYALKAMLDPFAMQQPTNSTRMHAAYSCFNAKRHDIFPVDITFYRLPLGCRSRPSDSLQANHEEKREL